MAAPDPVAELDEMRFGFGRNWADFVELRLSEAVIADAQAHLARLLRTQSLAGKVFLDIGCGSGIHSLAALRLGAARVVSFDYDADSVATTLKVREFAGAPPHWEVMQGSVLDAGFMATLPEADIVYSWGVLHHTGAMWPAVRNAAMPLKRDGVFYIALYSSDMYVRPPAAYWLALKRRYNLAGPRGKRWLEWRYALRWHILPALAKGRNPLAVLRQYGIRGMTYWTDVRDWLGGWPMDFASLAETTAFCAEQLGLTLVNLKTGEGCTEYVFARPLENAHWRGIEAGRSVTPLVGPFRHLAGQLWAATLPDALAATADCDADRARSSLMLYEDGRMCGLAHSQHEHIRLFGGGRFSHWGAQLFFSTSDGSDPNRNRRRYAICERY